MTLLAAMRGTGEREFFRAEAKAVGGAGFDQHQRLQGLDGGAWKDRAIDVAEREQTPTVRIDYSYRTAMAALNEPSADDFNQGWITHI
jgi:hypothetical protein